jgi:hypothetical protein
LDCLAEITEVLAEEIAGISRFVIAAETRKASYPPLGAEAEAAGLERLAFYPKLMYLVTSIAADSYNKY